MLTAPDALLRFMVLIPTVVPVLHWLNALRAVWLFEQSLPQKSPAGLCFTVTHNTSDKRENLTPPTLLQAGAETLDTLAGLFQGFSVRRIGNAEIGAKAEG